MIRIAPVAILVVAVVSGCSKGGGGTPTGPGGGGPTNHNPTVSVNTNTTHLAYGGGATITVTASDLDGDQLAFAYTGAGGTVSSSGTTATTASFTAGTAWGPASVTVTVTDGKGGSAQATALMYIQNPTPPRICCSQGAGCGSSYYVLVTPDESIIVTQAIAEDYTNNACLTNVSYPIPGLAIGASQGHQFTDLGCLACQGNVHDDWIIHVIGRRPEPDGGSFHAQIGYNPTDNFRQPRCSP
jgi:hypothetical protein